MNKIIFYIFAVLAFLIFTNTEIHACSCFNPDNETLTQKVNKAKNDSQAVFTGRVLEVIQKPEKHQIIVKLKAEKSWKGSVSRQITIVTASNSALCGYNFEVGKSYLIYAQDYGTNNLQTNLCTRTAGVSEAKADLKVLGKGKIPKP
ncbi:MAG TPA: hypothetical protein VF556_00745 [Pyrinomonadaceae bacterium]